MASLLDAVFMANYQRFDTANRASLLLILVFCTPLGVHRSVERMPTHRFPHPVGVRPKSDTLTSKAKPLRGAQAEPFFANNKNDLSHHNS
jgi:hypothetical protein